MIKNDNVNRSYCADGCPALDAQATNWRRIRLIAMAGLVAMFAVAAAATAARIDYGGTITCEKVAISGIVEASGTDLPPLYDPPAHTGGDTVLFAPADFRSTTVGTGTTSDITDGQLLMTINALDGHGIGSIGILEEGVYATSSPAGAMALAMVESTVFYWITGVDGQGVAPIGGVENLGPFTVASGDGTGPIGSWSLAGTLDIASLLGDPTEAVTEILLSMDTTLVTAASGGGAASIDCKGVEVNAYALPEPASLTLLGLGLCCLTGLRTRRK